MNGIICFLFSHVFRIPLEYRNGVYTYFWHPYWAQETLYLTPKSPIFTPSETHKMALSTPYGDAMMSNIPPR